MGISGNLKTMVLAELLQWLSMGQKTGTLVIGGSGKIKKRIFFDQGSIISSASTDPKEYLGRFLVNHGYVAEDPVNAAVARQKEEKQLLGKILVEMGTIAEEDLHQMLLLKAEESIYEIFTWEEGDFEFLDNELPEETMIRMNLDVQMLVLEGSRRLDEWNRIREVVPSRLCVPVLMTDLGSIELSEAGRRILEWIDDDRTIEEISQEAQTSLFLVASTVAEQVESGALKAIRPRTITVEVEVEKMIDPAATQAFAVPAGMQMPAYQQAAMQGVPFQNVSVAPGSPPQAMPASQPVAPDAAPAGSVSVGGKTLHFATSGEAPPATATAAVPPLAEPQVSEAQSLLKLAENALRSGDLESAADSLVKAENAPDADGDVKTAISRARIRLEDSLADQGLRSTSVPKLTCGMDELTQLDMTPQEGFLLTRVDGTFDVQSILKMSPMPKLEALMFFWRLKKSGQVKV